MPTPAPDSPFAKRKPNGTPPLSAPDPNAARLAALEGTLDRLVASQTQTQQTLTLLAQQLAQAQQRTAPAPTERDPDPEEDLASLNQNPRAFFSRVARQEAEEIARGQHGTTLQMAQSLAETILDRQRDRVAGQWGPDAWGKVIEPTLRPMLAQLQQTNPLALANKETVGKLVSMAVGEHVDALSELRTAHDAHETESISKAKESLVNDLRSQLPAPGLAPRRRLAEDTRAEDIPGLELMVKEHTAAGDKLDPDEVASWHTAGNTLDDVLPLLNKTGQANNGAET